MHLKALLLKNFRNYDEEVIFFGPRVNLITGENGQGKTNLLEAIFLLSTGRSFRTAKHHDLIAHKKAYFYIEARMENNDMEDTIKIYFDGTNKKIACNENHYTVFSSLLGMLPAVLVAPTDINLIEGSPEKRRRFLNVHQAQIDPLYRYHLARYFKALKHRNTLLKHHNTEGIGVWEMEMSRSALYLIQKRADCIRQLHHTLNTYLNRLSSSKDQLEISYTPSLSGRSLEEIQHFFEENRKKDLIMQSTQQGPHRDDLIFLQEKKKAKIFSSEGQKRTALLALKFAEWHRLQNLLGSAPLFSIDDFTIHLDLERLSLLSNELKKIGQVFLTAPEDKFLKEFESAEKYFIQKGKCRKIGI